MSTAHASSPLIRKLDQVEKRYDEVEDQLNDPAIFGNSQKLVALNKERGSLESIVSQYRDYQKAEAQVAELREMAAGSDAEMAGLAAAELPEAQAKAAAVMEALKDEFFAAEDNSVESFFIEIRAGTGGEEAALFARDLFEMYRKYAESVRWRFVVNDFSESERGGFKEVIVNVVTPGAYRRLRFE